MTKPALLLFGFLGAAAIFQPGPAVADKLVDRPVIWYEDDRKPIPEPEEREPNVVWDGIADTFVHAPGRALNPGRNVRRIGTLFGSDKVPAAGNVNALDEVANSTWFTNRIGLRKLSPADIANFGYEESRGPAAGQWTVVSAKTEGVTPGFNIKDSSGQGFLIKFDPPGDLGTSTAAGAICARIFHAIGYNVPQDNVVYFKREDLVLGENVNLKLPDGTRRPMVPGDLDDILARVEPDASGRHRAIASRFLEGKPAGPFNFKGRRKDDANDRVDHEDRRELRGLRMFAAWMSHFDTKQNNSLDSWVKENGNGYLRHHLIDFASTLGMGAAGAVQRYNYEYTVDAPAILGRMFALGFHEDDWRRVRRPEGLKQVAFFESRYWDPLEWKPLAPNTSFANLTDKDGYWAAKIISAFTDDDLNEIVKAGQYDDPAAADYVARTLGERRDEMARVWFDKVAPLDFFRLDGTTLHFRDLGSERGIYKENARYRARTAQVNADRNGNWSGWSDLSTTEILLETPAAPDKPFTAVQVSVDRGKGWSDPVTAYVARASGRVVAVEH